MEKIQIFLEGKKTFIGIGLMVVGLLNLSQFITPAELTGLVDHSFEIIGIILAIYGRVVAK
jgi:hypothetical protein